MKKTFLALALFAGLLCTPSLASAQVAVNPSDPALKLSWDYDPAALANVQGFRTCVDQTDLAITQGTATCVDLGLPAVTVTTATNLEFDVPFPAITPGLHTIVVTAYNPAGQAASNRVSFTVFVLPPAAPKNLRITPKLLGGV